MAAALLILGPLIDLINKSFSAVPVVVSSALWPTIGIPKQMRFFPNAVISIVVHALIELLI